MSDTIKRSLVDATLTVDPSANVTVQAELEYDDGTTRRLDQLTYLRPRMDSGEGGGTVVTAKPRIGVNRYHPLIARQFSLGPRECAGLVPWNNTVWAYTHALLERFEPWMMYFCRKQWHACDMADAHVSSMLADIVRSLEANWANRDAFGHALRHVIILAGTNVEARWKNVLKANDYKTARTTWTIEDYIRLSAILNLPEWTIKLRHFPEWPEICPFANWVAPPANPAKTPPTPTPLWYQAYVALKHEGTGSLSRATLQNAIDAVAACFVMRLAMFGAGSVSEWNTAAITSLDLGEFPEYEPVDWYVGDEQAEQWSPSPYFK